ncbi:hypothetical protein, partial [Flavobacterium pectinovorum]|uniref:hypothetical protein n=1 Tax=Flavobacterium pectinovorum TaxID=29533 RepID=UPI001FAE34AA
LPKIALGMEAASFCGIRFFYYSKKFYRKRYSAQPGPEGNAISINTEKVKSKKGSLKDICFIIALN